MMKRVLKIGQSAAITLPRKALQKIGVNIGDFFVVKLDQDKRTIILQPLVKIDPELLNWTKDFVNTYRPVMDPLVKVYKRIR